MRKTTVITYGDGDEPIITVERDNTRDMPRATQWQHPERSSRIPATKRQPAPTAEQAHTLFKRLIGNTSSARGKVVSGFGRITVDGDRLDI